MTLRSTDSSDEYFVIPSAEVGWSIGAGRLRVDSVSCPDSGMDRPKACFGGSFERITAAMTTNGEVLTGDDADVSALAEGPCRLWCSTTSDANGIGDKDRPPLAFEAAHQQYSCGQLSRTF